MSLFTSDEVLTMPKAVMIVNQRRNHSIDIPDSTFVKIRFQPEDAAEQNPIKIFQNLFNLTNGLFDLEKIELFVINATRNRFQGHLEVKCPNSISGFGSFKVI